MKPFTCIPLTLLLAAAAPAGAEALAIAKQPGFVVGHHAANTEQSIDELIPAGESVENWSRMITIQRFALRPGLTAQALTTNIRNGWLSACPGSTATPVAAATIAGRTGTQMRADCPLNRSTGKPEVMLIRVFAGAGNLHSVQVAFRRKPLPGDLNWADRVLASIVLRR